MRYTPRPKTKMPLKFIVRVREIENDAQTERVWEFLDAQAAAALCYDAKKNGLYSYVQKVLDRKRLERV